MYCLHIYFLYDFLIHLTDYITPDYTALIKIRETGHYIDERVDKIKRRYAITTVPDYRCVSRVGGQPAYPRHHRHHHQRPVGSPAHGTFQS